MRSRTATPLAPLSLLLAATAGIGCAQPDSEVGGVRVAITQVPADVRCVRIVAEGPRVVTGLFDVTPNMSSLLQLRDVPTGLVRFTGDAFAGGCATVTGNSLASWSSDPLVVTVAAGMFADVALVMHRHGGASIRVDFPETTDASTDGSPGPSPDASPGPSPDASPSPPMITSPFFLAAGAGVDGTADLNVPFPGGIQAGQLLILQLGSRSSNVPATPAGWTLLWADEHPNARQRLYARVATGTESGVLAVATGASNVNAGRIYVFGGVAASAFTEGAATTFDDDGTLPGPTVVTGGPGRLAVAFVGLDNNPPMAPFVGEAGGDWNEAVPEFSTGVGSNFGLQLQVAPMAAGGAISGGEANFGGSSDASICRAFALVGR